MLYEHLRITEDEVVNRLNKQYKTDIMIYDEIENQALIMADYMADGFRRQCFL